MKNTRKLLSKFVIAIDTVLLISVYILQYLSAKKMGVMRFLVYEKRKFEEVWFNEASISLYGFVLVGGIIICSLIVVYRIIKTKRFDAVTDSIFAVVLNSITYLVLISEKAYALKAYYFILIVLFCMIFLQYILIISKMLMRKRINSN